MRVVRKLLLVAALTAATVAFGASSASAVEVEFGGVHCTSPTLMTGHAVSSGCPVEARSERETLIQALVSGMWVSVTACEDHFEVAIGENGHGYVYAPTVASHPTPICTLVECDESGIAKIPWELQLASATNMEITFCLRLRAGGEGAAGTLCDTSIGITPKNATGQHEFWADGVTTGRCENVGLRIIGHWDVTPTVSHPAIAIN